MTNPEQTKSIEKPKSTGVEAVQQAARGLRPEQMLEVSKKIDTTDNPEAARLQAIAKKLSDITYVGTDGMADTVTINGKSYTVTNEGEGEVVVTSQGDPALIIQEKLGSLVVGYKNNATDSSFGQVLYNSEADNNESGGIYEPTATILQKIYDAMTTTEGQ